MKLKTSIFLLFISFSFYNFQCDECEGNRNGTVMFDPILDPILKEYTLLDTISLSVNMSSNILLEDETILNNANSFLSFWLRIMKVNSNNSKVSGGLDDFEIVGNDFMLHNPRFEDTTLVKELSTFCDSLICGFSMDLVPMEQGVFGIQLIGRELGDAECISFSLKNRGFDANDNNFDLVRELDTEDIRFSEGGRIPEPAENNDLYFFKVID